jgi:hypothetical protein
MIPQEKLTEEDERRTNEYINDQNDSRRWRYCIRYGFPELFPKFTVATETGHVVAPTPEEAVDLAIKVNHLERVNVD